MGKVKALIGVLVIVGGIYYAWNMIPPYFHRSQFQDELDDIARRATYSPMMSEDDVKRVVITKAQADDLPPLKENQIVVAKSPTGVTISVHYQVHIDMIVYQTDLDFIANSHNKLITS